MAEPGPIDSTVVFLAGASGGIGTALIAALREAGAAEIIAAARHPPPPSPGVTPLALDIADAAAVRDAAARCAGRVDIVLNSAGVNTNRRLFTDGFMEAARREMEVNYFGLLNLAGAFAPALRERRRGAIVHLLTFLAHVNLPLMASYCASKAAAHSITQALRAELSPAGVHVCGVYPAVVDTAMSAQLGGPKLAPQALAHAVVQALRDGAEDVYPGAAEGAFRNHLADPKQAERRMAQRLG